MCLCVCKFSTSLEPELIIHMYISFSFIILVEKGILSLGKEEYQGNYRCYDMSVNMIFRVKAEKGMLMKIHDMLAKRKNHRKES